MKITFVGTSGSSTQTLLYTLNIQVPFFSAAVYNPEFLLSTVKGQKSKVCVERK
jgi:hypothetical protein